MVAGGFIGIRRLSYASIVFISGFLAYAAYRGFHYEISNAIITLGIRTSNAFFISLFIVLLIPLFAGLYLGTKILNFLGISDYGNGYTNDDSNFVDRIFGSGFSLLIYLIILSIFMRSI